MNIFYFENGIHAGIIKSVHLVMGFVNCNIAKSALFVGRSASGWYIIVLMSFSFGEPYGVRERLPENCLLRVLSLAELVKKIIVICGRNFEVGFRPHPCRIRIKETFLIVL